MAISKKLQTGFITTFKALTIPIMTLNLLGGIISGIWLAILGGWGDIFRGISFAFISTFAISIALMPSILLIAPMAIAMEKGRKKLGTFFGSLGILYVVILITIWCIWIMWLFTSSANNDSLIPLLVWSYGVALSPWMWLAQKDQQGGGNEFSMLSLFFAQISYILGMILFFLGINILIITVVFSAIMLVGALLQILIAFGVSDEKIE